MHIDTGHNFEETIEFRDWLAQETGIRLIVKYVQDSIDKGRVKEETGKYASRNVLQTVTLLDAIEELKLDACIGGARRDEEKARAKERMFSVRDDFGQWDAKKQRPELFDMLNGKINVGENVRVFPISNWTELDVWNYIKEENLAIPSIYYSHKRQIIERDGLYWPSSPFLNTTEDEVPFEATVRFRTVGDMTCTAAVLLILIPSLKKLRKQPFLNVVPVSMTNVLKQRWRKERMLVISNQINSRSYSAFF
jgi:sulfate adenylyltransferase subunit 2